MSSNLIFHVVSKRNWQEFHKGGFYNPVGTPFENGIVCLKPQNLKKYINSNFKGRRQVLLLVIDKSRLISHIETDNEKDHIMVKGKINLDAILDKIYIKPNKEGIFDVEVTED